MDINKRLTAKPNLCFCIEFIVKTILFIALDTVEDNFGKKRTTLKNNVTIATIHKINIILPPPYLACGLLENYFLIGIKPLTTDDHRLKATDDRRFCNSSDIRRVLVVNIFIAELMRNKTRNNAEKSYSALFSAMFCVVQRLSYDFVEALLIAELLPDFFSTISVIICEYFICANLCI